ncbi:MAG: exodeoxyribonuclease VII small subunit [Candidatus Poseidoniales archaeon]|jgi:exodeoxyribonuclease VII small subunit|tara:strand:+ start:198 stop:407 length:210 start_codon:yes stop_codon:yes gene_type:complete
MIDMKYNERVQRLEEIVRLLDTGESELEETLALFEEGKKLLTECSGELTKAEGSLRKLTVEEAEQSNDD